MPHIIRIPATCLDVAPLAAVAAAMARSAATAGGTTFHKPTFDGKLAAFERRLVADARAGRLIVRDQDGGVGTVNEIVRRALADRTFSEVFLSPEIDAVDIAKTLSLVLYVCIPELNEWGSASGDNFTIDSDDIAWIDERGVVIPPMNESQPSTVQDLVATRLFWWVQNGLKASKRVSAAAALSMLGECESESARRAEGTFSALSGFATWLAERADAYDGAKEPGEADFLRSVRGRLIEEMHNGARSLTETIYFATSSIEVSAVDDQERPAHLVENAERQNALDVDRGSSAVTSGGLDGGDCGQSNFLGQAEEGVSARNRKESPHERGERLARRRDQLKNLGVKGWQKQIATEESVHPKRIAQILKEREKRLTPTVGEITSIFAQLGSLPRKR